MKQSQFFPYLTPSVEVTNIEAEQCFAASAKWEDTIEDLLWEQNNQFE